MVCQTAELRNCVLNSLLVLKGLSAWSIVLQQEQVVGQELQPPKPQLQF